MLTLEEYREELLQFVKATAESECEGTVASFVKLSADALLEAETIPDYELSFFSGAGRNKKALRIDGYAFDDVDNTFYLFVANYSGEKVIKTITKTDAMKVLERARAFVEEALNGNMLDKIVDISTPAYDLIALLRENIERVRKFKILQITDMAMSEKINEIEAGKIHNITTEFFIWDIGRFYRLYSSATNRDELEVDFRKYTKNGIPCLEANDNITEEYKSYLCIIPGNTLADIYDAYGSRLLEGNVRSFLSLRGGVNKAIRATILSVPERFFVYNNGIAATALDISLEKKAGKQYVSLAKDLQIVNGGQTTASLSSARYKGASLDKIFVQMKLTIVHPENANEIIPNISRCSNSQNKVSEADFFSNHPYHIRIEEISRRILAPAVNGAQYETRWYYERARGQYDQEQIKMTQKEKKRFSLLNPKSQLITKTDLAKVLNSWQQFPHIVSKGAQANFVAFATKIVDEWGKDNIRFNDNYFKEVIGLTILFKHLEKLIPNQLWYQNGYRANIVTYSIAMLSHMIEKKCAGKALDLRIIWQYQTVPDILSKQMEGITKMVFETITDADRDTDNVTQWCKREKCWKIIQEKEIIPMQGFEKLLVTTAEYKAWLLEGKKIRTIDNGLEAQETVLKLGENYWNHALEWAKRGRLVDESEIVLFKKAGKFSSGHFPNEWQCVKLLEVRERLIAEGFTEVK